MSPMQGLTQEEIIAKLTKEGIEKDALIAKLSDTVEALVCNHIYKLDLTATHVICITM